MLYGIARETAHVDAHFVQTSCHCKPQSLCSIHMMEISDGRWPAGTALALTKRSSAHTAIYLLSTV